MVTAELIQIYGWRTTCAITIGAGLLQIVLGSLRTARSALAVSPAIVHGTLMRHRCGDRACPAAHRARRFAAELGRLQRPASTRPVGTCGPGSTVDRRAHHRRPGALAPDSGTRRTEHAADPGSVGRGRHGDCCGRSRSPFDRQGRPAVLALARPAGNASGSVARPCHSRIHDDAGGQSGIPAGSRRSGQAGCGPESRAVGRARRR